jgi:hypothetical protein
MAFVRLEYCRRCEKDTQHTDHKCFTCWDRQERERIAIWNVQTVEEKLQDLRRRVEALEKKPPTY